MGPDSAQLSQRFVTALTGKDREGLLALLTPDVRMRGMAPGRKWKARDAVDLVDNILLGDFFGPETEIEAVSWTRYGEIVDKQSASYYLMLRQGDQRLDCEQTCFFDVEEGRISSLHLACSGFTPVPRQRVAEDPTT